MADQASADTEALLTRFIDAQQLPADFGDLARRHYLPLCDWVLEQRGTGPLTLGINGSQGSGKSTLAELLELLLQGSHGLRVARLSMDDIYLTLAQRQRLAEEVHPLLRTRGVPGTHDVALGVNTLRRLKALNSTERLPLPRFDKASDDRSALGHWPQVQGPLDVIIFEGWCLCSPPSAPDELVAPVNALEAECDSDGRWRRYVNAQLRDHYPPLFAEIDRLIMLKAPDFDCVYRWRAQQEQQLAQRRSGRGVMNEPELRHFVQHYQRLTSATLQHLPQRADVVFHLTSDHRIRHSEYRR